MIMTLDEIYFEWYWQYKMPLALCCIPMVWANETIYEPLNFGEYCRILQKHGNVIIY